MGGDDFQKKDSGLGLRDAITNKRQSIDSAATKRAHELFNEMEILQTVTNAIGRAKREVEILFPRQFWSLGLAGINGLTPFWGDIKWTTVIERFTKLIQAEGVEVKVINSGQKWGDAYDRFPDKYFAVILTF